LTLKPGVIEAIVFEEFLPLVLGCLRTKFLWTCC
jgi:hypothetical protein